MGLAPFPMEERVGLFLNNPKKSIVEECNPTPVKLQPTKNKRISWAEIVKGGGAKV